MARKGSLALVSKLIALLGEHKYINKTFLQFKALHIMFLGQVVSRILDQKQYHQNLASEGRDEWG